MKRVQNKIVKKKKQPRNIRNYDYKYRGQFLQMNAADYRSTTMSYHWTRLNQFRKDYTFIKPKLRSLEYSSKYLNLRRNSFHMFQHYYPGDKVWVIVYNTASPYGRTIKATTISEVMNFGRFKTGALKDYWLASFNIGHGIDANSIFRSYREAEFFKYY